MAGADDDFVEGEAVNGVEHVQGLRAVGGEPPRAESSALDVCVWTTVYPSRRQRRETSRTAIGSANGEIGVGIRGCVWTVAPDRGENASAVVVGQEGEPRAPRSPAPRSRCRLR